MELIFDKGTLLFKSSEETKPEGNLSAFLWDSRVSAYRAPAYLYPQILHRFNNPPILNPVNLNQVNEFKDQVEISQAPPILSESPNLRPYQQAALASWKLYERRGIIVLPTGSGKTLIAIGAIALLRIPTLILVPTRVLLDQWEVALTKYFNGPVGILGDGKKHLSSITVSTFESGYRYMSQIGNRFNLLIIDEIHHFGNGIRDEALEMCTAPYRLGLTATNVTNHKVQERLRELVGPTIYELTVSELKDQYLSPFNLFSIQLHLNMAERKSYEALMKKFRIFYWPFAQAHSNFDWAEFVRTAQKSPQGCQAFSAWQQARQIINFPRAKQEMLSSLLQQHRQHKLLIFTPDTATAYRIAKKHLIMPITSDIKRAEREEVLSKFREGRLLALVSCRVLNEGIDVPDAEGAIIVGGNHGEREHIQRIGRCLRRVQGKNAIVYELVVKDTMEVWHWLRRSRTLDSRVVAKI
ncbi:MAG: DEAD/DEAH box helicase [Deltaproteobacteria bacterium]|nr:DEAD/DEAH box helicase [Deltaproteobacteria bacterium]